MKKVKLNLVISILFALNCFLLLPTAAFTQVAISTTGATPNTKALLDVSLAPAATSGLGL